MIATLSTVPPPVSSVPAAAAPVLERLVLGNPVWAWVWVVFIILAVHLVVAVARRVVLSRLRMRAERSPGSVFELLVKIASDVRSWCVFLVAVWAATQHLALPFVAGRVIKGLGVGAIGVQVLISSRLAIDFGIKRLLTQNAQPGPDGAVQCDATLASATGIIRFIAMLVLAVLLGLLVLQNIGIQVTPLITGLGIGGIAIALAAQNVLGDLFGSLSIIFDKPFLVGDFIIVGDKMGTVEQIGVKTTRIRALSGEQLVFTNQDLLGSRIQNFKRMQERRAAFTFGVTYETPPALLREIPGIVRNAVEKAGAGRARFDRSHFKTFGAYSLDFENVLYVNSPDMAVYLDIQQQINLNLIETFAAKGIDFAYPTQVEIVRGEGISPAEASTIRRPQPDTTERR